MKKILIATNVLLLGIIFFIGCNSTDKKDPAKKPAESGITETGIVPIQKCTNIITRAYDGSEIEGTIDAFVAKEMSQAYARDAYKKFIWPGEGNRATQQDARCIWFELDKMKSIISQIENSVCGNECKNQLKLGVRIYYAKYPAETGTNRAPADLRFLPADYAGRHTVFLVGTYDKKGVHIDFDPANVEDKCEPTPYAKLLEQTGKKYKIMGLSKAVIALRDTTVNHGDLMPPPDGSGIFPTGGN